MISFFFPNLSLENGREYVEWTESLSKARTQLQHAWLVGTMLSATGSWNFCMFLPLAGETAAPAGFVQGWLNSGQQALFLEWINMERAIFKWPWSFVVYLRSECYFSSLPQSKYHQRQDHIFSISTQKKRGSLAPSVKDIKIWGFGEFLCFLSLRI